MPAWKVITYSCAISAMPLLGFALGSVSNVRYLREVVETIPVLVCLMFVLRLPERPKLVTSRVRRVLLLAPLALLILGFADFSWTSYQRGTVLVLAVVDAIAIGVSEELTFRFHLHRLWSQYSATFYVVTSSLIFGVLHFRAGILAILITTIIGGSFALARIAGMSIMVLIVLHGLIDLPGRLSSMAAAP